jgi:hypothetical protein
MGWMIQRFIHSSSKIRDVQEECMHLEHILTLQNETTTSNSGN